MFKNQYLNYNSIKGIDLYYDLGMTGALLDVGICNLVQIIFFEILAFKVPKKVSRLKKKLTKFFLIVLCHARLNISRSIKVISLPCHLYMKRAIE